MSTAASADDEMKTQTARLLRDVSQRENQERKCELKRRAEHTARRTAAPWKWRCNSHDRVQVDVGACVFSVNWHHKLAPSTAYGELVDILVDTGANR